MKAKCVQDATRFTCLFWQILKLKNKNFKSDQYSRLVQALTLLTPLWQLTTDYKSQCHLAVRPLNHMTFLRANRFTMVTKIWHEHDTFFLHGLNFRMSICGLSLFTLIKVMTCFCRQSNGTDLIPKTNIRT